MFAITGLQVPHSTGIQLFAFVPQWSNLTTTKQLQPHRADGLLNGNAAIARGSQLLNPLKSLSSNRRRLWSAFCGCTG